jgi:hypothetical protein
MGHHCSVRNTFERLQAIGFPQSHAQAISALRCQHPRPTVAQAFDSPRRQVLSAPRAHGPSESGPVRAVHVRLLLVAHGLSVAKDPQTFSIPYSGPQSLPPTAYAQPPQTSKTNMRISGISLNQGLMTSVYQRIRGLCHRLPCITDLSHSRVRARSSVLHLTVESARGRC